MPSKISPVAGIEVVVFLFNGGEFTASHYRNTPEAICYLANFLSEDNGPKTIIFEDEEKRRVHIIKNPNGKLSLLIEEGC